MKEKRPVKSVESAYLMSESVPDGREMLRCEESRDTTLVAPNMQNYRNDWADPALVQVTKVNLHLQLSCSLFSGTSASSFIHEVIVSRLLYTRKFRVYIMLTVAACSDQFINQAGIEPTTIASGSITMEICLNDWADPVLVLVTKL